MSDQSVAPEGGQDTAATDDLGPAPSVQAEQQPERQERQEPSYEDRLNDRLEELARQNQALMERFEQYQVDDDDDDDEEYEPDPDDPEYDEWAQQKALEDLINERVQQALTPLQQQQQIEQRNQAYNALVDQYPQMADEKFASSIVGAAADLADQIGLDPNSPRFVDLIQLQYKAHVADEAAKQEKPAGQRPEVRLESGGGAAPADRDEEIQDRMSNSGQNANFLI